MPYRELRAEEVLEEAPDAIAIADAEGRLVYANALCERMLGYSRQELAGMTPAAVFATEGEPPPRFEEMREGKSVHSQRLFRRKDGRTFVASLSGRMLSNGAFIAFIRDESERQRLTRELERRTHELGERVKERRCLLVVMEELHETDDLQSALARIVCALPPGWQYPDVTVARIEVDGSEHRTSGWRETRWTQREPIHHMGEPVGFVEVGYLKEHAFIPEERELLQAIARRIGEAVDRQRTLEALVRAQRLEAVGQLAGGVAHDFNNVLTAISSFTSLAADTLPASSSAREDLDEVLRAADRARELTRQLLAFSRRQVLTPRVVDVGKAVGHLERMLGRIIGEHVELRLALEDGVGSVHVDPAQLEHALVNLAVNARDAMPSGGRLSIRARNTVLTDPVEELGPGDYVEIAVADDGHGMDETTASRVFEPFFTTKEQGHGTGLGLATVYGIVRQSGGAISVDSAPGQGATFRLLFPRVKAPEQPDSREPAPRESGGERVLVVEDDELVRRLALRVLRRDGYDVLEARNGHEAVEVIDDVGGDLALVVTDVVMPGLGAAGVLEHVGAHHPHVRSLVISGYSDDPVLRELHDVPFLPKPFTPATLLAAVREALDTDRPGADSRRPSTFH